MLPKKRQEEIVLQIRCKSIDTKIAFKLLAVKLDENFEETLKRLLKLEKEHPLPKEVRGEITRF